MTVRCPSCATTPSLFASDIGPDGSMVRCARCGTRWLARTYDDDPYRRPAFLSATTALAEVSEAVVIEDGPPAFTRPRMLRPPPPLSARMSRGRRRPPVDRRLKALGLVFGVLAAFFVLRAPIVAALPQLGGLPAEVDRLEFQKVRSETVQLGGVSTLFIEGEIVNRSAQPVDLPAVRVTLRSAAGNPVTSWLVELSVPALAAGRAIGFRSALASPPPDAAGVTLNLARREGQTIGLR